MKKKITKAQLLEKARKLSRFTGPLATRADFDAAEAHCKAMLVKNHPDRGGNSKLAADTGEARQIFKNVALMFPGKCGVCGCRVNRGATHCRVHMPSKSPSDPTGQAAVKFSPREKHVNSLGRWPVAPVGGRLARLGFYAHEVQAVVKKWQPIIGETTIEHYFSPLARAAILHDQLEVPYLPHQHMRAFFEIGLALVSVMESKDARAFLLSYQGCATNGRYESLPELSKMSGFTKGELQQAEIRLRLNTDQGLKRAHQEMMNPKWKAYAEQIKTKIDRLHHNPKLPAKRQSRRSNTIAESHQVAESKHAFVGTLSDWERLVT